MEIQSYRAGRRKIKGTHAVEVKYMSDEWKSNRPNVDREFKKAIEKSLEEIGLVCEGYAKSAAPVDTGRLRNSITHAQETDDVEIIGTNVEYAPYQEAGGKRAHHPHFLRNAAYNHYDEYQEILRENLR